MSTSITKTFKTREGREETLSFAFPSWHVVKEVFKLQGNGDHMDALEMLVYNSLPEAEAKRVTGDTGLMLAIMNSKLAPELLATGGEVFQKPSNASSLKE